MVDLVKIGILRRKLAKITEKEKLRLKKEKSESNPNADKGVTTTDIDNR